MGRGSRSSAQVVNGVALRGAVQAPVRIDPRVLPPVPVAAQEAFERLRSYHPQTVNHSERVAIMAQAVAIELGMGPSGVREIGEAGLLHDLGKSKLAVRFFDSTGALTPEERRVMQGHSAFGSDELTELGLPQYIIDAARGHHEKLDGTGYPDGLAGNDIPEIARLLAVADVFEALTSSSRRYTGFQDKNEAEQRARRILVNDAGTHFDPRMVAALISVLDRGNPLEDIEEAAPMTAEQDAQAAALSVA